MLDPMQNRVSEPAGWSWRKKVASEAATGLVVALLCDEAGACWRSFDLPGDEDATFVASRTRKWGMFCRMQAHQLPPKLMHRLAEV